MWTGKQNAWIRLLSPRSVGAVGESLAQAILGGTVSPNNRLGYDLEVDGKLVEVKLATMTVSDGYPAFFWHQIRPKDPYTHICFVAVYPDRVRMFLVPRTEIPADCLKHSHGRDSSIDIFSIVTRRVDDLFPWMTRNEIS